MIPEQFHALKKQVLTLTHTISNSADRGVDTYLGSLKISLRHSLYERPPTGNIYTFLIIFVLPSQEAYF